ncbi:MAG: hypothetical protein IJ802_05365 [Kiritimatiellae bacterium]|nr:hypothetical protein [Kiritimatiellia bacterium]
MKKIALLLLLPLAAFGADFFNATFGVGANDGASNEATVAVGDSAAAYSAFTNSVLLGAAAGILGGGSNVVAIGYVSAAATRGDNRTEINGQFSIDGASNRFFLRTDPGIPATDAPVYYDDGTLYLNVDRIVTVGGVKTSGFSVPAGCDYYVSSLYGSDSAPGTSSAPLATMDAAIAKCTENGQTVCVLPGRYPFPETYACTSPTNRYEGAKYALNFIAPGGTANTIIDGSLNATNIVPCVWGSGVYYNYSNGYDAYDPDQFLSFDGFTFIGARYEGRNKPRWHGAYSFARFYNCDFEGDCNLYAFGRAYFNYCILSNCTANLHLYSVTNVFTDGNFGSNEIMEEVYVVDSAFSIDTQNTLTGDAAYPNFGCHDYLENSFFDIGGLNEIPAGHGSCALASGVKSGAADTTFIASCMVKQKTPPNLSRCLVGIGDDGKFKSVGAILTAPVIDKDFAGDNTVSSAAAVRASLKDRRPVIPAWRFYGFDSAFDRAWRDELFAQFAEKYSLAPAPGTTEEQE